MFGNSTPFSRPITTRPPLLTIGGAVSVAAAAETPITSVLAGNFGYLLELEAICTIASTGAGTWTLRSGVGLTIRLVLQQPINPSVVGTRYCWAFPMPWKTDLAGGQFTITPSAATLGTWIFFANGMYSST